MISNVSSLFYLIRYELVKLLRNKIETQLGSFIDDELDRISLSKEAQQHYITAISNKILSSQELVIQLLIP